MAEELLKRRGERATASWQMQDVSRYKDGACPRFDANSLHPQLTTGDWASDYCRPSFSTAWQLLAAVRTSLNAVSLRKSFNKGSSRSAEYAQ